MFLSSSATRGLYPGVLVGYTAKIEASSWVNSGLHGVILLSICQPLTYNIHLRNFSPWGMFRGCEKGFEKGVFVLLR